MERRAYIALEGPIGVGKTTLAQVLARELNARLLLEEGENNPFLARFYDDPEKYAIPVQLYFLLTRYNQQRELLQQTLFEQSTVADYLFAKDRVFANLNLAPDELVLYEQVYKLLDSKMARARLGRVSPRASGSPGGAATASQSRFRTRHQLRVP